ncbi:MAG: hypothetical protein IT257_05390 [Chitinophagaceae bacterium]|nr:hypothetical protein [Chitinophagaceae bacterium]
MKKVLVILLYILSVHVVYAQKSSRNMYIGFQAGVLAPVSYSSNGFSKYKVGLPSFSYAASIENRFTLNYRIRFSVQYSITYFDMMAKNLERNMQESQAKAAEESKRAHSFSNNISFNSLYRIKNDFSLTAGVGVAKPIQFMDKSVCRKNVIQSGCMPPQNNKFVPNLNPFFMVGIENTCRIFNKNLIYSIQYNIGFAPYRTLPVQKSAAESQYTHGVNIGLKYKY